MTNNTEKLTLTLVNNSIENVVSLNEKLLDPEFKKMLNDNKQNLLEWLDAVKQDVLEDKCLGLIGITLYPKVENNQIDKTKLSIGTTCRGYIDSDRLLATIEGNIKPYLLKLYQTEHNLTDLL